MGDSADNIPGVAGVGEKPLLASCRVSAAWQKKKFMSNLDKELIANSWGKKFRW